MQSCPAINPTLSSSTCPEHVLSITDSAELAACRACPRGRALMETLRHKMPERLFTNLPPLTRHSTGRESPTKEEGMLEEPKTYTVSELAILAGVTAKDICNAKENKEAKSRPGSRIGLVKEYMRNHGILWDHVEFEKKGPKSRREAAVAEPEPAEPPLIQAARDMEPEDAPEEDGLPIIPPVDAFVPRRPQYTLDFDLRHIPMEALVSEIARRMPGVRVSFG